MLKNLIWAFIFISLFRGYLFINSCEKQMTCHDCIRDPSHCVWCAHNNATGIRCKLQNSYDRNWCPETPQNPTISLKTSEADNREFSSDPGRIIQIKPQRYRLKARIGVPINFNFSFKGAKDYPVDIYFLLDASSTMANIHNKTAMQSENIYKTMKHMTSDVYLGMGTFIDKNALPFKFPTVDSTPPYSFKHRLKLNTDFMEFKNTISNMTFGHNRDPQEGGLDALAQVIVCKDVVGWRNESRKIIVLVTDAPYHAAGDGKAAGLIQPYDGACYTENDVYTKETQMDYPSVGIINMLTAQHDIITLFLIEDKYDFVYQELSRVVSGSKAKSFSHDSINSNELQLGEILKDIYQKITKTVTLKTNVKVGDKKNIKVSFDPDCARNIIKYECWVKNEEEKQFTGTLEILEYDGIDEYLVEVAIEGISEKLTLHIDIIKDCDCEKNAERTEDCHGEIQQCGICECGDKRYGDRCACVRNEKNMHNDNITCIAEGTNETCSGRGSCFCGTCNCNDGYEGKYCECNEDDCPRDADDKLCSGQGKCECGKCFCKSGWTGDECQCPLSNSTCIEPTNIMCNNRGYCDCGQCQCNKLAPWDSRYKQNMFCHISPCPQCHATQCQILEKCALSIWGHEECRDNRIRPKWTSNLTDEHKNGIGWNRCPDIKVDVGCYSSFVYRYNDQNYGIDILVLETTDCIKSYLLYGGVCLFSMLVIGIITLVAWKLLTEARDKREYLSFVNQHKGDISQPCVNPLYESATTTFNNPTFGN